MKTAQRSSGCSRRGGRAAAWMAAAAGLAGPAWGQAVWTGTAGNNQWLTAQNWNPAQVPGASSDAVVPAGFPEIFGSMDVRSVSALSPLRLSGAICAQVRQPSSIRDATIFGGIIADGLLTFTGSVTSHTAYSWIGSGGYRNTGTFTSIGCSMSSTFTNDGTLRVTGTMGIGSGSSLLRNNGTLELAGTGTLLSGGLVVNNATWRRTGAGTSDVQCRIDQASGSLGVEEGLLRLTAGGLYRGGAMTVDGGATLQFEGPFGGIFHTFDGMEDLSGSGNAVFAISPLGGPGVEIPGELRGAMLGTLGLHLRSGGIRIMSTGVLRNQERMTWGSSIVHGPGTLVNDPGGVINWETNRNPTVMAQLVMINHGLIQGSAPVSFGGAALLNRPDGRIILTHRFDDPGNPLYGLVQNEGAIEAHAISAGVPSEIGVQFEQMNGGVTSVPDGALSLQGGGTLGAGGGRFEVGNGTAAPVTLGFDLGTYQVTGPGHVVASTSGEPYVYIRNANTTINVQQGGGLELRVPYGGELNAGVVLNPGASLGGPGSIANFGRFVWQGQIGVGIQANFTNEAPAGTIMIPLGAGPRLRGTLTNRGFIIQRGHVDLASATLRNERDWVILPRPSAVQLNITNSTGLVVNQGHIQVIAELGGPTIVSWNPALDNLGRVSVQGDTTLIISGAIVQLNAGVLSGGEWVTTSGRLFLPNTPPIWKIAGAVVNGSQATMPWLTGIGEIDGGRFDASGNLTTTRPMNVRRGTLGFGAGVRLTVPLGTMVGAPQPQTILGYSEQEGGSQFQPDPPMLVTPTLTVHGGLRPGGPDAAGPYNLTGNLVMMPDGFIETELGGPEPETEHDRVTVTGGATLGGTLQVRLLPGFVPQAGQQFAVLTATGAMSGAFSVSQPPGMPAGMSLEAVYAPGSVALRVVSTCYANCDGSTGSPTLNVNDFVCFSQRFASGDPYANCDGSTTAPTLNVNDFVCFSQRFAAGCR